MTQQAFTFAPKPPPPKPTLEERAAAFVKQCPEVYRAMVRMARAEYEAGATRISAKRIWEELRARNMGGPSGTRYRMDNTLCAPLAARLCDENPDMAPLFELRARAKGKR